MIAASLLKAGPTGRMERPPAGWSVCTVTARGLSRDSTQHLGPKMLAAELQGDFIEGGDTNRNSKGVEETKKLTKQT